MTMMSHLLIRLHGDEDWDAWGDDWWDHVERLGELEWAHGWHGISHEVEGEPVKRRLDWGAVLYELSRQQVEQLADEPDWLQHTPSAERQRELLAGLRDEDRYGVVFVEMY